MTHEVFQDSGYNHRTDTAIFHLLDVVDTFVLLSSPTPAVFSTSFLLYNDSAVSGGVNHILYELCLLRLYDSLSRWLILLD
jgi:hypothetical protein